MYSSTLITTLAFFAATGLAGYVLEDDYFAQGFLDQFTFYNGTDTNQGFVAYQNLEDAKSLDLIQQDDVQGIYLGVDYNNTTPNGRPSIHLTSNKSYKSGLIVANITHMPGGICGTWPAFWTVGPNWPNGGEIDILEGVNDQTSNNITLHTGPSCTIDNNGGFSGAMTSAYCGPTEENSGCQITADNDQSYGGGFNSAGGAIYAMEWTSSAINIYFFTNSNPTKIPTDILGASPDPSTWGTPVASFAGDFDMATAFVDQQIVLNIDFCGSWAGNVWDTEGNCAATTGKTCEDYVANNPAAFKEAYWSFAALKVYQDNGDASTPSSSSASAPAYSSTSAAASSTSAPAYLSSSAAAPSSTAPASSASAPAYSSSAVVPSSSAAAAPSSYSASAPSISTYVETQTTIVYVTAPVAQPTTFAVSASASASGYAPVINGEGDVGQAEFAAPSEGMWSTSSDGEAVYGGKTKRGVNVKKDEGVGARWARHLGRHRRGAVEM